MIDRPGATPDRAAPLRDPGLAALPAERLLDELLGRLSQAASADVAQFLLIEGDALRVTASRGVAIEQVAELRVPLGHGFAGVVAADGAPRVVDETPIAESFGPTWAEEVIALAGVPLIVEGRVIGVCVVGSRSRHSFDEADVQLLSVAAERAAWAVEHGVLLAAERRAQDRADWATERLRGLQRMSHELLADDTVDDVVRTVVDRGLSLLGARAGGLWSLDVDAGMLRLRGATGYPAEIVERWREIPLDADAPAAEAARTSTRIVLRSVQERDERYPALAGRAFVGEGFICAPLVVGLRTIGIIGLGFADGAGLVDEDLAFVDAAVAQCATAMHRALTAELQRQNLESAEEAARRLTSLQRLTATLADVRDARAMVDIIVDEVTNSLGGVQVVFAPSGVEATGDVVLPLGVADRTVGTLALTFDGPRTLTIADTGFLNVLADQCAHALERGRLLAAETVNRMRLELLAEAGRIFSAPLDVQLTSQQFCRLVVGRIADAASVHLRQGDGSYHLAAAEHTNAAQARLQRDIGNHLPDSVVATYDAVVQSGRPLLTSIPLDDLIATNGDSDLTDALVATRPRSNMLLPLVAGGHDLGVLAVTTVEGGHEPLTSDDLDAMAELAGRLALAIDSARLLRQQTEIAYTLQRSLLPAALPEVPGAEVAVRYLPGAQGVDVGGDFYDVIPLPNARFGLVVGDVMGRGVRAAAVMGQLRASVRAYSLEGHSPAALLARLDQLVGTLEEGLLVTALYGEWEPARGLLLCATAGHLPPLLRLPGRAPDYLEIDPGAPLGVGMGGYAEVETELPPGSLLLAFTDGLVEGPDLPVDDGMARLLAAVSGATGAMDACDAALAELRPAVSTRNYDDDTALLALVTHPIARVTPRREQTDTSVSLDLPADLSSPARSRTFVAEALTTWGMVDLIDTGTLLTSELVTNGVRHAGTGMRVTVSRIADDAVRIAVTDHAPGVAVRVKSATEDGEGGRGLFLVEHLSGGWGATSDDTGKTVWFELRR